LNFTNENMEPTVIGLISAGAIAVLILAAIFLRYKFPESFATRKLSYQNTNIQRKTFMVNSKYFLKANELSENTVVFHKLAPQNCLISWHLRASVGNVSSPQWSRLEIGMQLAA